MLSIPLMKLIRSIICFIIIIIFISCINCYPLDPIEEETEHPRLSLISWRWHEVEGYFIVSVFLLTAAFVKIAYHQISALHTYIPESCVLIVLGTTVGIIIYLADITEHIPQFTSEMFFFLLLPPIILESAYSLYDKTFFNHIHTVLLYAVLGTLLNVFFVGSSIFLVEQFGWFGREDIPLVECFTFSTLISAVDPVAVLAIFQELGVNKALYFLVFGESLLNDAVVITLYNMVTTFAVSRVISTYDVIIGILNFITVSGGGLIIGATTGALTALATRISTNVRVVEPLVVVVFAYFSYVGAELFHFSGIISLIACGLVQSEYVKDNISKRSFTTIKYFTKTLSSIADVIIFFFLGRVLIREDHVWDTGFVFFSTFFCIFYRFVIVFLLTYIANRYIQRVRMINFEEQLLMAYGGLRGAIAFSLAIMLEENHVKHARIFITTSLFIVLFTVFVLGSTTKPVVRWLGVQLHVHYETSMFIEINNKVVETVMSGIEEVAGHRSVNYWSQKLHRFNEKYLKSILTRGDGHSFKDTFELIYSGFIPVKPSKAAEAMESNQEDPTMDYNLYYTLANDRARSNTNDSKEMDDDDDDDSPLTDDHIIQVPVTSKTNNMCLTSLDSTGHRSEMYLLTPSSNVPILTTSPSSASLRNNNSSFVATTSTHSIDTPTSDSKVKIKFHQPNDSDISDHLHSTNRTQSHSTCKSSGKKVSLLHPDSAGNDNNTVTSTSTPSLLSPNKVIRVATDEDLSDLERRFIASAFSRSAYYQLPEKDEIEEERAERLQQQHRSSRVQRLPYLTRGTSGLASTPCLPLLAIDPSRLGKSKNKWTSAKFKLEKLATTGTDQSHASTQSESSLHSTDNSLKTSPTCTVTTTTTTATATNAGKSSLSVDDADKNAATIASASSSPHLQSLQRQSSSDVFSQIGTSDEKSNTDDVASPENDASMSDTSAIASSSSHAPRLSIDLREELEPLRKILLSKRKSSAFAGIAETAMLAKRWQEQQPQQEDETSSESQGASHDETKDDGGPSDADDDDEKCPSLNNHPTKESEC